MQYDAHVGVIWFDDVDKGLRFALKAVILVILLLLRYELTAYASCLPSSLRLSCTATAHLSFPSTLSFPYEVVWPESFQLCIGYHGGEGLLGWCLARVLRPNNKNSYDKFLLESSTKRETSQHPNIDLQHDRTRVTTQMERGGQ